MEIIIFSMLMATILVKNGITDAKAYAAGRTPDRFHRSEALIGLADKAIGGGKRPQKTKRRRARAYLSQCLDEAWQDAADRRRIRHEAKAPVKAERYRRKIEARVKKKEDRRRNRELRRANKRLDRELSKTQRRQVRDRYNRPSSDVHAPVEPYQGWETSRETTDDGQGEAVTTDPREAVAEADTGSSTTADAAGHSATDQAQTEDGTGETGQESGPAAEEQEREVQSDGADVGLASQSGAQDSGGVSTTGAATRSGEKGAASMSEQMTYEGGLANALAYCESQASKRGEDAASVSETITGLQAARYGDEVTRPLGEAQEALETAVAAFGEAVKVLQTYTSVQEAYEAAPGAPEKDELLAHQ